MLGGEMPELNSTSFSELGQIYSHIPSYTLIWTSYTLIDLHCGGGGYDVSTPKIQLPFDLLFRIGPKQLFTLHTFMMLHLIATRVSGKRFGAIKTIIQRFRNHVSGFFIVLLIEILSPAISLKS